MDEVAHGVQRAYDTHAAAFAAATAAMPDEVALLGRQLLAALASGGWILDAGCGPGRDMVWFEAQGARVLGADRSPALLAVARQAVRGPLARMDLRSLAAGDASFAGAWCNAALLHLPPPQLPQALAELRRVVVPGGPVAITLQAGAGAGWEDGAFGRRFFARYEADALRAHLQAARLPVRSLREWPVGRRRWLNVVVEATDSP